MGIHGLKIWLTLIAFFLSIGIAQESSCISCHIELDEDLDDHEKIVDSYLGGVHAKNNLDCSDCHGGDPEAFDDEDEAMWDAEYFRSDLTKIDQLEMCGSCHSNPNVMKQYTASIKTDQVDQYETSHHGIALENGNEKAATCTDCHGVHGILEIDHPKAPVYPFNIPITCSNCHSDESYMAHTDLPTDQYKKYESSVHGIALFENEDVGAPTCNDCHGNHGAAPPDIVHVKDICGTCHINNQDLFQTSHLQSMLLSEGFGQCEACHGNHDIAKPNDDMFDWSEGALCYDCHADGGPAKDMSNHFYSVITNLNSDIELATSMVHDAENKGMIVDELLFDLEEAHKVLIHTRTNIHSFNIDFVDSNAIAGFEAAQAAVTGAQQSLDEFDFRRKGLFYFSLIITFTVIVLGLKIKVMK